MLQSIAPNLWHVPHNFQVNGVVAPTRMTVVRLADSTLWLHSPVPIADGLRAQLNELGEVAYVVAPSKTHHLFVADCMASFPKARLYGAPGLKGKRPDLSNMIEIKSVVEQAWQEDLAQIFFAGIPFANETVWFHKSSKTLIVTDLLQCYEGDVSPGVRMYAWLTGTRNRLAVPRTVRWLVKDREAAADSARKILLWPFERVIVAHNAIVGVDAYRATEVAFGSFN
jgi:Domain of unknown function (DUF4336)